MDTRIRPLETNGLWPGDKPVSWQVAVTEERNRQATEIHNTLVPDLAGILLHLEAAKEATESRPHELPRCTGSRKDNCLFFEPSKFRTSRNQELPSRYPLMLSTFCMSEAVGTATAKARFERFQFMNRHQSISADARSVKRTGRAGSWTKWPVQIRVSRWQYERFVPLVTRVRARVSGGELFQIVSGS